MDSKDFYSTSDLNIAATLLTLGKDIAGINPVSPKRVVFYWNLEKYPEVPELASYYWGEDLLVNPRSFINNRNDLMDRIREAQRESE